MLLVRTARRPSDIHGMGLFADQFIPAGTATWRFVLCADDARLMNHSDDPTVVGDYEAEPVCGVDIAARDIEPGQELTCDYATFDKVDRQALHFQLTDD